MSKLFVEDFAKNPDELSMVKTKVSLKVKEIIDLMRLTEVVPAAHIDETPDRIAKMYVDELFAGCFKAPPKMKIFQDEDNTPVLSTNINISSCCSHHGVPFYGHASIYYVPKDNRITGLSKFYRVCDYFARRPQVQERLTKQIGNYIWQQLDPHQLVVVLKCEHMCVSQRGAKAHRPLTITRWAKGDLEYPITQELVKEVTDSVKE